VQSSIGGVTTTFVGNYYEVSNDGSATMVTKYYYAGSQRIATLAPGASAGVRQGEDLFYLLSDQLGSTSITTDANGQPVSELRYDAWGGVRYPLDGHNPGPSDFTYTGQYSNVDDFGLLYYNARWYDPTIARFVQADTIVPDGVQGWDRYAYTANNPIRYNDPSGHMNCEEDRYCPRQFRTKAQERQTAQNIVSSSGQHYSMSTKINSSTVLSHDHYALGYLLNGSYQMNTLVVAPESGGNFISAYDGNGNIMGGTSLLTVNGTLTAPSAPLASQATIASIRSGDSVDVVYWDDASTSAVVGTFTVRSIQLANSQTAAGVGSVTINSGGAIGPGDSGSGIFFHGQLIGNVSSTEYFLPSVFGKLFPQASRGELLPSYILPYSTATTPVR
jgi:RHS repeat-associated protein